MQLEYFKYCTIYGGRFCTFVWLRAEATGSHVLTVGISIFVWLRAEVSCDPGTAVQNLYLRVAAYI